MTKRIVTFSGDKGGSGKSPHIPVEGKNTLSSNSTARIVDIISEGEIEGLVDGLKSVYINETQLQLDNGSFNFNDVTVTIRTGTPDQDYIDGFPAVESEVAVGTEVKYGVPVVRTITDANATAVVVKVRTPAMSAVNPTTADSGPTSFGLLLSIQANGGGYVDYISDTISGKTTSPYEKEYRMVLPVGGAPWDIKFTRTTPDTDTARVQHSSFWSTYTKVIDNKIQYADSAVIGVELPAEQFDGQIPSRAYEIYGIRLQIPSNYDPITRVYTGIWDGTFTVAWSDNPAWVMYDLMTNKRYGIGSSLPVENIDKFSLYEIAKYCDELVPDGFGGMEPRFRFNGVINTADEAYNVLNQIATVFRGMIYWSSGLVYVRADKDETISKIVSPANVIDGIFTYSGSSLKTRNSVAVVTYNDPSDFYRSAVVAYEDPELIEQIGWRATNINAYGCTSKGQAYRLGKWLIDTEKNSTELVVYQASFDNADLVPGNIIAVADPSYAGLRYGGRLVTATLNTVTLDQGIVLQAGKTYSISCVMPDGTIEDKNITTTPDDLTHSTLTLESDFSDTPMTGAMWVISSSDLEPRLFRVLAVKEIDKNKYEISALYHDVTKYARVENDISLEEAPFSVLVTGPLSAPSNLSLVEYLYLTAGGEVRSAATISWTASPDARASYYQVEVMRPETDFWVSLQATKDISITVFDLSAGIYQFRVKALDAFGVYSEWYTESFTLRGQSDPPSDVMNLRINNVGAQSNILWDHVSDLDLDYYTIKYSTKITGATWGESIVLALRIPAGATYYTVPTLIGTYMIKAVDKSGNESVNATLIVSNISDVSQDNIIQVLQEDPSFAGTKTNIQLTSGVLKLIDLSLPGYYYFDNDLDLGDVYTSRVIPALSALGDDLSNTMDTWTTLAGVAAMASTDPAAWMINIQVRTTNDNPAGTPTWTAWNDVIIGDYTCRAFQFRAVLISNNGTTTPVIEELSVTIDMPDRVERGNDVLTNISGVSVITFSYPFREPPAIAIAGQNMATGDYFRITSKSEAGFTVTFYNAAGAGVQRTFDWTSSGFGRQV